MNRFLFLGFVATTVLAITACPNLSGTSQSKIISVSFGNAGTMKALSPKAIISVPLDSSFYKPSLANPGLRVGQYTPANFILDMDTLNIYKVDSPRYSTASLASFRTEPSGVIIPRNIDIKNSAGFIRDFSISEMEWDGLALAFLNGFGVGGTGDGLTVMSIIIEVYDNGTPGNLYDDIVTFNAERGATKYRKEVLLPSAFSADKMTYACHNGILEIRFSKH